MYNKKLKCAFSTIGKKHNKEFSAWSITGHAFSYNVKRKEKRRCSKVEPGQESDMLQGENMNLLNWLAAFAVFIAAAGLLLWSGLLAHSKNKRTAIAGNILQAIFVLVLVTGYFLLDRNRNMHWSGNLVLDLLTVIVSILIVLLFIMYFCSRFEKCRIILDTRNRSMKEKRLYLYRRLQDMNAGFRFVYVAGKDILLWLLPVIAIAGLLTRAFVSDGDNIFLTGMYLLMCTSQALRKFKDVKRKRKLLRRFRNAL